MSATLPPEPAAADPEGAFETALRRHGEGRLAEAERLYRLVLQDDPGDIDARHNLAVLCLQSGRHRECAAIAREALRRDPEFALAHNTLGVALRHLGHLEAAADCCREALRLDPDYPAAHANLGAALRHLGRLDEAEASCREALRRDPQSVEVRNDLIAVLGHLGRWEEAETYCREALRLRPQDAAAHNNLGAVLAALGRHREAIGRFREAVAFRPDHVLAHCNLGAAHLLLGQFEAGWREQEWRWRAPVHPLVFDHPQWKGEALDGRTLLLHPEQGFGDTIQFCRYLPLIDGNARTLLLAPRPLARLLGTLQGVDRLLVEGEGLPDFDLHCPLMSLPLAFGTTLATVPARVPYLAADPDAMAFWRRRMSGLGGLRVGLVWASNPHPVQTVGAAMDRRRKSLPLAMLARLAAVPSVDFVSLQIGEAAAEASSAPPGLMLHDWTGEIADFADTAALIAALDLVIGVDTSVVHLAGALGKPVWLLNRFDACWRWLRDRDDSPWYPSLRQFRQPALGDWDGVVARLAEALAGFRRQYFP